MRKFLAAAALAVVLAPSFGQGAQAQRRATGGGASDAELRALRREVEALREGQQAIQAELQELKKLMREVAEGAAGQRQPTVSVDDDPAVGESTAKVVLIDFSDYQ